MCYYILSNTIIIINIIIIINVIINIIFHVLQSILNVGLLKACCSILLSGSTSVRVRGRTAVAMMTARLAPQLAPFGFYKCSFFLKSICLLTTTHCLFSGEPAQCWLQHHTDGVWAEAQIRWKQLPDQMCLSLANRRLASLSRTTLPLL